MYNTYDNINIDNQNNNGIYFTKKYINHSLFDYNNANYIYIYNLYKTYRADDRK